MSVCTFLASDHPLPEYAPPREYPLEINIDEGTIYDGGTDDNYFLTAFTAAGDYTQKQNAVSLEWNYTEGRARQLIAYIKEILQSGEPVELRHVWLTDYWEFEDRPYCHRKTISIAELTPEHIRELDSAPIWNRPDREYPDRPSFYCLTILP